MGIYSGKQKLLNLKNKVYVQQCYLEEVLFQTYTPEYKDANIKVTVKTI